MLSARTERAFQAAEADLDQSFRARRPNRTPEAEARVGTSFRQLWGTGTGPQQQGTSGTCGEERNALRPSPVPEGDTHPGLREPPPPPSCNREGPTQVSQPPPPPPCDREAPTQVSASHRRSALQPRRHPLRSPGHRRLRLATEKAPLRSPPATAASALQPRRHPLRSPLATAASALRPRSTHSGLRQPPPSPSCDHKFLINVVQARTPATRRVNHNCR